MTAYNAYKITSPIKRMSSGHGIDAIIPVKYFDAKAVYTNTTNYLIESNDSTHSKTVCATPELYCNSTTLQVINNKQIDNSTYVPDIRVWTNIGTAPFVRTPIINSGNNLYAICTMLVKDTATNKIYTASLNNPTIWTDTGKTMPIALYSPRIVLINNVYYIIGDQAHSNVILSAPYSDPTTWTQIGTFPYGRDNADYVIYKNKILLGPGYNGGTYGYYLVYANVSTLTNWNVSSINLETWEECLIVMGDYFKIIGGTVNQTIKTYDSNFNLISSIVPDQIYSCDPTVWEIETNKYYGFGFGADTATSNIRHLDDNDYRLLSNSLPGNINYIIGSEFIDKNGYLYIFNDNGIYRSGRKLSSIPSKSVFNVRKSWLTYSS